MIDAIATKSAAQIAHEARNAQAKATAAQAKIDRFLAHVERNNQSSVNAAARRADDEARAEAAALASATRAYAEEIEARFGIAANDNFRVAKAA